MKRFETTNLAIGAAVLLLGATCNDANGQGLDIGAAVDAVQAGAGNTASEFVQEVGEDPSRAFGPPNEIDDPQGRQEDDQARQELQEVGEVPSGTFGSSNEIDDSQDLQEDAQARQGVRDFLDQVRVRQQDPNAAAEFRDELEFIGQFGQQSGSAVPFSIEGGVDLRDFTE